MATLVARKCPICGHDNSQGTKLDLSRDHWELKRCTQCTLVYLENPPEVEALADEYAWEKTSAAETERRFEKAPLKKQFSEFIKNVRVKHIKRRKLRKLIERFSQPGPILDVGCAWGHTLMNNLPEGYVPYGLEISKDLAEKARERFAPLGGDVLQGDAFEMLENHEPDFFNAVTEIALLEHVPDPIGLLARTRRVLVPGGVVIIKVPNFGTLKRRVGGHEWCGYRFPDHLNYFTPKTLLECGRSANLEVARFGALDKQQTSDNMWIVFRKPA